MTKPPLWIVWPVHSDIANIRKIMAGPAVAGALLCAPLNDPTFQILAAQANACSQPFATRVVMLPAPPDLQTVPLAKNFILPCWRADVVAALKAHMTAMAAFIAANGWTDRWVEHVICVQGAYDDDDEDGLQLAADFSTDQLQAAGFTPAGYFAAHADFAAWLSEQPWAQGMTVSWRPFTIGHEPHFDVITGLPTAKPEKFAFSNGTLDAIKSNYTAGRILYGFTTWDGKTPLGTGQQAAANAVDGLVLQAKTSLDAAEFEVAWEAAGGAGAERFEGHPDQAIAAY